MVFVCISLSGTLSYFRLLRHSRPPGAEPRMAMRAARHRALRRNRRRAAANGGERKAPYGIRRRPVTQLHGRARLFCFSLSAAPGPPLTEGVPARPCDREPGAPAAYRPLNRLGRALDRIGYGSRHVTLGDVSKERRQARDPRESSRAPIISAKLPHACAGKHLDFCPCGGRDRVALGPGNVARRAEPTRDDQNLRIRKKSRAQILQFAPAVFW